MPDPALDFRILGSGFAFQAKRSAAKRSEAKRSEAKRSEAKRSEAKRSEAKREAKRSEKRSEAKRSEAKRSEKPDPVGADRARWRVAACRRIGSGRIRSDPVADPMPSVGLYTIWWCARLLDPSRIRSDPSTDR